MNSIFDQIGGIVIVAIASIGAMIATYFQGRRAGKKRIQHEINSELSEKIVEVTENARKIDENIRTGNSSAKRERLRKQTRKANSE